MTKPLFLQAFAEPSQHGTTVAPDGQEASSAHAAAASGQGNQHTAHPQASAAIVPPQQQALAEEDDARQHKASNEQAGFGMSVGQGLAEIRPDQNTESHSGSGMDLHSSNFDDDDPSNPDGKLMSLLMG